MEASLDKNIRPPKETSEPTNNRAFKDASDSAVSNPLVVKVLFVNVCVAVKVAKVSVPVGIVIVPLFDIDEITGLVKVLFVKVCVPVKVAKVSVPLGIVIVPLFDIDEITGLVSVLFVRVSLPVKVANVRVPVGIVIVPLFDIDEITGLVSVLLLKVCDPVRVAMLVESAESIIEAEGNVTVPVTDNPPVVVKRPLENNLPLIDASEPTKSREFNEPSPELYNRPFSEMSPPRTYKLLFLT
jgi:hypothetical protein